MILWFTGQPGSGKTTLCNEIQEKILYSHYYLKDKIIHIDGDDLRKA
jgi:adenylylsulfate kinase-like enzyme